MSVTDVPLEALLFLDHVAPVRLVPNASVCLDPEGPASLDPDIVPCLEPELFMSRHLAAASGVREYQTRIDGGPVGTSLGWARSNIKTVDSQVDM